MLETVSAVMVKVADCVLFPIEAITFAVVEALTLVVVTEKDTLVEPGATVTVVGTLTFTLSAESEKVVPPEGAAEARVTVPVREVPPATEDLFSETRTLPLCAN